MSKSILLRLVTSVAFLTILAVSISFSQKVTTGTWTASVPQEAGKLNLNLDLGTERGNRHQIGQNFDLAELQGLSRDQITSGGPVKFSLVREAGAIECEGTFQGNKGSGTFSFTPNQAFISGMKSRGFDFEAESSFSDKHENADRLLSAAALNVTTALADDLASAGFGKLNVEDLFKAAIFKVDSNFMREMKASGYPNMGMEELVKARIFKIDADFVRQVTQMGFDKEPFESLVKMRIFKVTPEFITEVRNEGLNDLQIEELVKLKIFKIDSAFIRQAKAEGVPIDVERLVQRRIGAGRQ